MPTSPHDPLEPIQDRFDRRALVSEGLTSMDEVWQRIGEDDGALFRGFPDERRARILRDLFLAASLEAKEREKGGWSRFWPDLLLAAFLLLLLGLGIWAITKKDSVAVALRDIRQYERLSPEMLHGAHGLELPDGKQPGLALRPNRNVPAGDYIFAKDLERFEVVAMRTVPKDATIPADAVWQEWKPYRKEPAARLDQVIGNRATQEIRAGETVRLDQVVSESESVLVEQLVASRRLPRLRPITAADFRAEKRPRQPGTLVKPEDAVGRYPLQEIEAGTSLVGGQLSPGILTSASLAGRQLLTVHVQPPSFRLMPQLPARIGLAAAAPAAGDLLLPNVLVLSVESGKDGPALVVALTEAELKQLVPFLPESEIFVLQPPP